MASIDRDLRNISSSLFLKYNSEEREIVKKEARILIDKLRLHFGDKSIKAAIFGSFDRDTILPREFDSNSDVDILVVFNQQSSEFSPKTYRNRLLNFVEKHYKASYYKKNHPAVVLELKNIKFDLVPSRLLEFKSSSYLQIPDSENGWLDTYPFEFRDELKSNNVRYKSLIKPIIRLLKRWNVTNNYPYKSFMLEKEIAGFCYKGDNLQSGFLYAISELSTYNLSQKSIQKLNRLKKQSEDIETLLSNDEKEAAIRILCKILDVNYK